MTEKSDTSNPFTGLVNDPTTNCPTNPLVVRLNDVLEFIFRFTVDTNRNRDFQVIYLEDTASQCPDKLLTLEMLESAIFERLLLENPEDFLIPKASKVIGMKNRRVLQQDIILYLFDCYETCYNLPNADQEKPAVDAGTKDAILQDILKLAARTISYPEAYPNDDIWRKYFRLLRPFKSITENTELRQRFFMEVVREVTKNENSKESLLAIIRPILSEIERCLMSTQTDVENHWLLLLETFVSSSPEVAEIVIDCQTPNADAKGRDYESSIFGWYLKASMELKNPREVTDHYRWSPKAMLDMPEVTYHTHRNRTIFGVFKKLLLVGPTVRKKTMMWISNCLFVNSTRTNDWYSTLLRAPSHSSDNFMIGLVGGVLLKFCEPIFSNFKFLSADPTYCAVPAAERDEKGVHMRDRYDVTCLLPIETDEQPSYSEKFVFITECFFLTHKGIELTYSVLYERCMHLSREILNAMESRREAEEKGDTMLAESANMMINRQMRVFTELKGFLCEPTNLKLLKQFHEATAIWLLEVTSVNASEYNKMVSRKCYAPVKRKDRRLPFGPFIPPYLKFIPEYILENLGKFVNYHRRFDIDIIQQDPIVVPIFQVLLLFMGSNDRARNPHLRAFLAEVLACFTPSFSWSEFYVHEDRMEIVPNLLNVYVSIEMTGQSVEFEQKFNYRRPMYKIMTTLLERSEQVTVFQELAGEAQKNMEAANPPIFLRFVNLLINDAIYLLDESISNMKKIRELQLAREDAEWHRLPLTEQRQQEHNLTHLGMIARFENIIGRDTIQILQMITHITRGIFCHASMVDRMASMLNYFLFNLVGPSTQLISVKNRSEFEFSPGEIVIQLAKIYVNLSESDEFCLAVAEDGRSYSDELFEYAEKVLILIRAGEVIGDLQVVSNKVKCLGAQHKKEQEALGDPPQEYLDPIMSTLMKDPVILPSSGISIDRATILRHFLSDQTDPFNRSKLEMDKVRPDTKLKQEITDWIANKRKEYRDRDEL